MAAADDRVELTDLDVITRYSLAVRHASASRDELIATLRDDLAWLEGGRSRGTPAKSAGRTTTARATKPPTAKAPAKNTPRTKTPATKTPVKKLTAKKTTGRRTSR